MRHPHLRPTPILPPRRASAPNAATESADLKKQDGVYILHANVDEVILNCAVLDAKGQPVMDLNRNNFRVWEDGVAEHVNSVQHLDLPVSMGLLIDNSGSMRDKRAAVNAAAYNLLNDSNPQDEAFVVNFSDHAYLDQRLTTDRVVLDRGISRSDSAGTTAMYDAVAASAKRAGQTWQESEAGIAHHYRWSGQCIEAPSQRRDPACAGLGWARGVYHRTTLRHRSKRSGPR